MIRKSVFLAALSVLAAVSLSACTDEFTPEEAVDYVQSALDASYRGEFEEYVSVTDSTLEEAEAMYQQNIENVVSGIGVEELGISEELSQQYRDIAPDLLALAKYEAVSAEETDAGFDVEVSIEPFTGYEGLQDELNAAIEEEAAGLTEVPTDAEANEIVYRNMLELLIPRIEAPTYGEAEPFTIHVIRGEDNMYEISEEDLVEMDYAMFPGEDE